VQYVGKAVLMPRDAMTNDLPLGSFESFPPRNLVSQDLPGWKQHVPLSPNCFPAQLSGWVFFVDGSLLINNTAETVLS
jgi:hypothetical protein